MWQEGRTYTQIGVALHCTRSTVAGHLWRHRNGYGEAAPADTERYAKIRAAMRSNGGNKRATIRELGVCDKTIRKALKGTDITQLPPGQQRAVNKAADPNTRSVIDAIYDSDMTDEEIAERVGIARSTLSRWRSGRSRATPFLTECVREALTEYNR